MHYGTPERPRNHTSGVCDGLFILSDVYCEPAGLTQSRPLLSAEELHWEDLADLRGLEL